MATEFTEYQKQMERTFGVPAQFFPADEPTEELDVSGGMKFGAGWDGRLVGPPLTPAEEAERLGSIYGVHPAYWPVTEAASGQAN